MKIIFFRALLNKLKRMKRTYLSLQRLRRKKKESNKGFKKMYHISQSATHQNANSNLISSPSYTDDLCKVGI